MQRLIIFAIIGFFAQLVDGSLGMAYGVTSSSLLLLFGISPAVASASVHMAEVVTTAASGVSHIRFGNVDKRTVYRLILPGSLGAFIGACFLSNLPGNMVKPYIAIFLFSLGVYVLFRFLLAGVKKIPAAQTNRTPSKKLLVPLGFIAGFADSTGGGGWGPLATPVLLSRNELEPRKVIGSVDTSEFVIASSATLGFLISLGLEQFHLGWVFALMIGGVVAAPIAAWLVRKIPSAILGVLVGGLIMITNLKTLLETFGISSNHVQNLIYLFFTFIWAGTVAYNILRHRKQIQQSEQTECLATCEK
ncbi:sulfite exporter TauE/SafE family protein [Aneurinibacillus thermoaerophilus]|uniref:sulfite exporter TauE/SafE family protein n=1 Tax=Aneurinibacillus thermoaerophilus TaxID=143495 RepID=UPI002E2306ED|nr:sulfite exporter TauE/SafE family protein [Aneurinibacillus thermoaerophilus]